MTPLSDEHRKALEEALTKRPVGAITSRSKFAGTFQAHAYHEALLESFGLSLQTLDHKRLALVLVEHIYCLQARLDRLEAKRK